MVAAPYKRVQFLGRNDVASNKDSKADTISSIIVCLISAVIPALEAFSLPPIQFTVSEYCPLRYASVKPSASHV